MAYRPQYLRNAEQMRGMLAKAEQVAPRKYRGYTVDQLREHIARFEYLATCSTEDWERVIDSLRTKP